MPDGIKFNQSFCFRITIPVTNSLILNTDFLVLGILFSFSSRFLYFIYVFFPPLLLFFHLFWTENSLNNFDHIKTLLRYIRITEKMEVNIWLGHHVLHNVFFFCFCFVSTCSLMCTVFNGLSIRFAFLVRISYLTFINLFVSRFPFRSWNLELDQDSKKNIYMNK